MNKPTSINLLLHHHLGLGDYFVCNGLVRYVHSINNYNITLVVKKHNLETIKALYSDLNFKYMIVEKDSDVNPTGYNYAKIGFEHCKIDNWEKSFYDQIKLDYLNRYKYSLLPRNQKRENYIFNKLDIKSDYAFCNAAYSGGEYKIDIKTEYQKIYLKNITNNLLDWIGVIENAKEIHTIDTSVFQMIKNMNIKSNKYFYDIRQKNGDGTPYSFDNQNWILK
jgi:hypothetical protein